MKPGKNRSKSLFDHLNRFEHKTIKVRGGHCENVQLTITPGRLNIQLLPGNGMPLANFSLPLDTIREIMQNEPQPLTENQLNKSIIENA